MIVVVAKPAGLVVTPDSVKSPELLGRIGVKTLFSVVLDEKFDDRRRCKAARILLALNSAGMIGSAVAINRNDTRALNRLVRLMSDEVEPMPVHEYEMFLRDAKASKDAVHVSVTFKEIYESASEASPEEQEEIENHRKMIEALIETARKCPEQGEPEEVEIYVVT